MEKYKVIKEFQFLGDDKKIIILKVGTYIKNYKFGDIEIGKDIIDNNPDFFEVVDWKNELLLYMKANKIPQPAVLSKKLYPFVDMIVSELKYNEVIEVTSDDYELVRKERMLKLKEDEIDNRLSRVEKREQDLKEDIKILEKRESILRDENNKLELKENEFNIKTQLLNEKERNFDRSILESSKDIDNKYIELQNKIDNDLKELNNKEKELNKKESKLLKLENELEEKLLDYNNLIDELKLYETDLRNLEREISNWENLHWKFKRNNIPPSAIPETLNPDLFK